MKIILLRELEHGDKFRLVGSKDVMGHIRKFGGLTEEGVYWGDGRKQYWMDWYWVQNPEAFDNQIVHWPGDRRVIKIEPFKPKKIELKQSKQLELW